MTDPTTQRVIEAAREKAAQLVNTHTTRLWQETTSSDYTAVVHYAALIDAIAAAIQQQATTPTP